MNTVFVLWLLLTGSPNVGTLNSIYKSFQGCYNEQRKWTQVLDSERVKAAMESDKAVCVEMPVQSLGHDHNYRGEVYFLVVMPSGPPNLRTPRAGILMGVYWTGDDCYADSATKFADNHQQAYCGTEVPKP
jgi:hypothetical protein